MPTLAAVSINGWFYLSKVENTHLENCIYLQLTIKLTPHRKSAKPSNCLKTSSLFLHLFLKQSIVLFATLKVLS